MSDEKYKTIEHPLESVLDIDSGTTQVPDLSRSTELVSVDEYDEKDKEVERQFQEVYDAAMEAFDIVASDAESIEPKYRARSNEVAVQFLTAALNAAKEKSTLKIHKDKLKVAQAKNTGPKTVNQNLIVDRNDVLKALMGQEDDSDR